MNQEPKKNAVAVNVEPSRPLPEPMNDVFGEFTSKLDPFFTSSGKEAKFESYRRWDKDVARSALATTRHSRYWTQGIIGVKSPNSK